MSVPSLTKILIKIFVKEFYREHAGMLLFLFVSLISYCLYIQILNDILPDKSTIFHLLVLLTFVSSPVMMILVLILWIAYAIKSYKYINSQLSLGSNLFLLYSSTAIEKIDQFKSWFIAQLIISLPIVAYGLIATVIGIIFHHYVLPAVILFFIVLLTSINAILYVRRVNKLIDFNTQSFFIKVLRHWGKPYFSLFLYHIVDKMKVTYVISKLLSFLIIIGLFNFLPEAYTDVRLATILVLGSIMAHTIIIYESHRFEEVILSFSRNFPYRLQKLFGNFTILFCFMILPECFWVFFTFSFTTAIELFFFGLSTALLFRSLLYLRDSDMGTYLPRIFYLFILFFILIMFGLSLIMIPIIFISSWVIFVKNYYRAEPITLF